jgi:hypothetical protein
VRALRGERRQHFEERGDPNKFATSILFLKKKLLNAVLSILIIGTLGLVFRTFLHLFIDLGDEIIRYNYEIISKTKRSQIVLNKECDSQVH